MTAPQQSCPRCHLYLSARGCTPERCANPEGAAELERMGREDNARLGEAIRQRLEAPGHDPDYGARLRDLLIKHDLPPNDLADFCGALEDMGAKYERGKTKTGWYVKAGGGCFFFEAQGKLRPVDVDREVYTRLAGTIEIPEGYTPSVDYEAPASFETGLTRPKPPSDLDTFRAMLERAESQTNLVDDDAVVTGDMVTIAFDGVLYFNRATGALLTENEGRRRMGLPEIK